MPRMPSARLDSARLLGSEEAGAPGQAKRRSTRRRSGSKPAAHPVVAWAKSAASLNSMELQTACLLGVWASDAMQRGAALSASPEWQVVILTLMFMTFMVENELYKFLSLREVEYFTERWYGKLSYWFARHLVQTLVLSAFVITKPDALLKVFLFFVLLCLFTTLLILPWPIEGYELQAQKAQALQAARQQVKTPLAWSFARQALMAIVLTLTPGSVLRGPVFMHFLSVTECSSAALVMSMVDLQPYSGVLKLPPYGEWMTIALVLVTMIGVNFYQVRFVSWLQVISKSSHWAEALVKSAYLLVLVFELFIAFVSCCVLAGIVLLHLQERIPAFFKELRSRLSRPERLALRRASGTARAVAEVLHLG